MSGSAFRVGAARLLLEPPLGLPMAGFVRQRSAATGYGRYPLETTAIALERSDVRVILCGVDIVGMDEPDITRLITDVATATGAEASGVLINWNHTHLAPIGGFWGGQVVGPPEADRDRRIGAFADVIQQKVVSVCKLAVERLEPARPVWGIGTVDLAVNRRERSASGETILGWNADELVDNSVTTVQFRRSNESALATLVSFGCHPVTTGYEMTVYSADYPGAIREAVRGVDGGECVFFQGAGGNVLPRSAFTDDETEASRMGKRIGLEAIRSVADRFAVPQRMVRQEDSSVVSISKYKRDGLPAPEPVLEATHERVRFPLLPHPSVEEVAAVSTEWEARLEEAVESGDLGQIRIAWYHASWACRTGKALVAKTAPTFREGVINAVRIGDGVIVTGPGEVFTEIGLAVKERGPGTPTMYCGYTNGLVSYFPTAAEYAFGGYEADYGCRSTGNPSHVAPECERILCETAVRCAERLFPDVEAWNEALGWTASGLMPRPLPADRLLHPSLRAESPVE